MTEEEYRQCIAEALIPEYHRIMEEAPDEHEFSPKFKRRMDKLIRRRKKPYYRFINTAGKRVAVIILAFIAVSFTTVMSVEALRTPFLDFITSIFSDHSEVKSIIESDVDYPDAIIDKYDISMDMTDYIMRVVSEDDISRTVEYIKDGTAVLYHQITVKTYDANLNNENAETERININGHEAIGYYDNHNYYNLIWNNGEYIIDIASNIGKDVLIEIAKSVQKVEK